MVDLVCTIIANINPSSVTAAGKKTYHQLNQIQVISLDIDL